MDGFVLWQQCYTEKVSYFTSTRLNTTFSTQLSQYRDATWRTRRNILRFVSDFSQNMKSSTKPEVDNIAFI